MNKVVESLHQKFPSVSKSQLRNKVREMSDFVDNRWQVKKEVLDGVGVRISPEKGRG
uniref:Chromatin assembly factor 1 subunit Cac1-like C-terminal domain-containing protein n=1 Tax=Populus trichocarpa TaxID=3694 RepID=A0A2K1YW21_POPTR